MTTSTGSPGFSFSVSHTVGGTTRRFCVRSLVVNVVGIIYHIVPYLYIVIVHMVNYGILYHGV